MKTVTAKAHGKIILTGEHSVIHKQLAIAMPFYAYTHCKIQESIEPAITIHLNDLHKQYSFIVDNTPIPPNEFSLPIHVLSLFQQEFHIPLSNISITINSEIPMNVGLGSSSAFIISMIKALIEYYNLTLNKNRIFKVALEAENLVHGKSSGLDLSVALHNKIIRYQNTNVTPLASVYSPSPYFHIINTGMPSSTTLDCVQHVNKYFKNSIIWDCFGKVALSLETALVNRNLEQLKNHVSKNHQLLCELGIVPPSIQSAIKDIEDLGGSAKVSGAGAITGNNAGMLIALIEDTNILHQICSKYQYQYIAPKKQCLIQLHIRLLEI